MTVQEPNDIDEATVADRGLENFAAIVYEKSPTTPGLKQLGLTELKGVLGYNAFKADNIAKLCGFPKGGGSDQNKYDYNGDMTVVGNTVLQKIANLETNTGVTTDNPVGTPLATQIGAVADRTTALENTVGTVSPASGLVKAVADNSADIANLYAEIGEGGGSGSGGLSQRISHLEEEVDGVSGNPGLVAVVGDSSSGLVKDVADLKSTVGDSSDGLVKDVADNASAISDLQTTVGDPSNPQAGTLVKDVADLKTTIGNGTGVNPGLVGEVNSLKVKIEGDSTATPPVKGLNEKVADLETTAYKFQGSLRNNAQAESEIVGNITNLVSGMVWRCENKIEFWYPEQGETGEHKWAFEKDVNFAYDAPEDPTDPTDVGTFHSLGINFNTGEFNNIVSRFGEDKNPESTWNCPDEIKEAGTYLISGMSGVNATNFKSFAFIAHFNAIGYLEGDPIDLGGFTDTFTNSFAVIALKSGVTFKTGYGINITRLGV